MRTFLAAVVILGSAGCTSDSAISTRPAIRREDREVCMKRTSDVSSSPEQAQQNLAECLRDVKSGKLALDRNDISDPKPLKASSLSTMDQYKYCVLHQDQVKQYYDAYTGLVARLALIERDKGSSDIQAITLREKTAQAESNLRRLLPDSITGETPLIPDAAMKFSMCNRSEFIEP